VDDEQITHLSQIQTQWTMIFQAHQGQSDETNAAIEALMERYGGAVYRYLVGITRDPDLAGDLAQEFALRFLRGDFRRADPRHGRFRNFVKTSVMNLVIDHHRRKKNRPQLLGSDAPEAETPAPDLTELDQRFLDCWREEILERAWSELARLQERTGQPFHTVLRLRADQPELRSPDMAKLLSERLGKPVNAGWVRQTLLRSREKFIALIIDEVSRTLGAPTLEQLDEELMDLGLWDYCKSGRKHYLLPICNC
jgi:RNA polymerase sigma factor (sigma-70 family)